MSAASRVRTPSLALAGLHLLAFACGAWAVYQWMELVVALGGGDVSCSISETINCTEVWSAPSAKAIHAFTGVPVAGWGLVWALVALVAPLRLSLDLGRGTDPRTGILGVRLVAVAGAVAVVALFGVSVAMGVFCPTCIATYVLVLAYVGFAFFGLKAPTGGAGLVPAALPLVGALGAGWTLLLWPGLSTPTKPMLALPDLAAKSAKSASPAPDAPPAPHPHAGAPASDAPDEAPEAAPLPEDPDERLAALVAGFPPQGKMVLRQAVEALRAPRDNVGFAPRSLMGPADAPVVLTDFADVRCGHCAQMVEALHALREEVGDRFAEDSRYFPLSANCNPEMPEEMKDPTGARCYGAKVLLCSEKDPAYAELRRRIFQMQRVLTKDAARDLAAELTQLDAEGIEACVTSSVTASTLRGDIEYATRFDIQGTPLVLINGREVPSHPAILYALILANGNPEHPAFRDLPELPAAEGE